MEKSFYKTVLKDQHVLKAITKISLTRGEVEKYFQELVKFYYYYHNKDIKDAGIIPYLKRDTYLKSVYFGTKFANNKAGRLQKRKLNIKYNYLNVFRSNDEYKNASINRIMKKILPWQKKHWKTISMFLAKVLANQQTKGLFISGEFGIGKTYLSCAIANEFAENDKTVAIFKTMELFQYINMNFGNLNQIIDDFIECDVLVVDDLGREPINKRTNWFTLDFLYVVLSSRYLNNKPVIISSNLLEEDYLKMIFNSEGNDGNGSIYYRFKDFFENGLIEINLLDENTENVRKLKK